MTIHSRPQRMEGVKLQPDGKWVANVHLQYMERQQAIRVFDTVRDDHAKRGVSVDDKGNTVYHGFLRESEVLQMKAALTALGSVRRDTVTYHVYHVEIYKRMWTWKVTNHGNPTFESWLYTAPTSAPSSVNPNTRVARPDATKRWHKQLIRKQASRSQKLTCEELQRIADKERIKHAARFTVIAADMARACKIALRATSKRRFTIPVLQNLLVETANFNRIAVTGTDLDLAIRVVIPARVEQDGATTLPGKALAEYTKLLADDSNPRMDWQGWMFDAGADRVRFKRIDADEFPALPDINGAQWSTVDADSLMRTLDRTASFAGNHFEVVNLVADGRTLAVYATDGIALWREELQHKGMFKAQVDASALKRLRLALSETLTGIRKQHTKKNLSPVALLAMHDKHLIVSLGETQFIIRATGDTMTINDTLIGYSPVQASVTVDNVGYLASVVKRFKSSTYVTLTTDDDSLSLTGQSAATGQITATINATTHGINGATVYLDPAYLIKLTGQLKKAKVDKLTLDIRDTWSPMVVSADQIQVILSHYRTTEMTVASRRQRAIQTTQQRLGALENNVGQLPARTMTNPCHLCRMLHTGDKTYPCEDCRKNHRHKCGNAGCNRLFVEPNWHKRSKGYIVQTQCDHCERRETLAYRATHGKRRSSYGKPVIHLPAPGAPLPVALLAAPENNSSPPENNSRRKAGKRGASPNTTMTDVIAQCRQLADDPAHFDAMQARSRTDRSRGPAQHMERGVCWPEKPQVTPENKLCDDCGKDRTRRIDWRTTHGGVVNKHGKFCAECDIRRKVKSGTLTKANYLAGIQYGMSQAEMQTVIDGVQTEPVTTGPQIVKRQKLYPGVWRITDRRGDRWEVRPNATVKRGWLAFSLNGDEKHYEGARMCDVEAQIIRYLETV